MHELKNKLIFAVDFDGTLCQYDFPGIGKQTEDQKKLMNTLINLRNNGHKIILWTNRGDNENYKSLTEAIEWCKNLGLEFDAVNKNLADQELKKKSGYSPKIMADYYIDDKALAVGSDVDMSTTLDFLQNIK